MRKSIAATFPVAFPLLVKTARLKAYGFIAIVFLAGYTATTALLDFFVAFEVANGLVP